MSPSLPDAKPAPVLVVDDDSLVLEALETTVRTAGYEVIGTENPLVGLRHLQERTVSVIITDQRMDGMSGLELLEHARRLQPHASRILITGLLSVKMLTEALNCGEIYRFIAKPWSTPELINTIHNAVQRYQLLCENAALQAESQRLNEALIAEKLQLEAKLSKLASDKTELDRVLGSLKSNLGSVFQFCEAILNAFDPALATRTRQTVGICQQLAEAGKLPQDLRESLIASAWFHDLGMIAVQRGAEGHGTSDSAAANLRDHPAIGERLALSAGLGEKVAAAVRGHHESFDGGGFPDRLRGRQIPEIARWLTPVAYFVSSGLGQQRAIEELERLSGVAFDPHVVPSLLGVLLGHPSSDKSSVGTSLAGAKTSLAVRRAYSQPGRDT